MPARILSFSSTFLFSFLILTAVVFIFFNEPLAELLQSKPNQQKNNRKPMQMTTPQSPIAIKAKTILIAADVDANAIETATVNNDISSRQNQMLKQMQGQKQFQLDENRILQVIGTYKGFLKRCYAKHLQQKPEARGKVDLHFIIEATGKLSGVKIARSTIADLALHKCIIGVVSRARFKAKPKQPLFVTYPIFFE